MQTLKPRVTLIGYWIEIACKHGGYNSAFLYGIQCEWPEAITHCLEFIARVQGRNFGPALTTGMSELGGGGIAVTGINTNQKIRLNLNPHQFCNFL